MHRLLESDYLAGLLQIKGDSREITYSTHRGLRRIDITYDLSLKEDSCYNEFRLHAKVKLSHTTQLPYH
jgi:hypothetical protein